MVQSRADQEGQMLKRLIAIVATLMATAVGSGACAQAIQPGKWTMTTHYLAMQTRGMPPAMVKALMEPITTEKCVTPAEAAQGFKATMARDKDCAVKTVTISAGMLDAVSICKENGGTRTLHLHGPYSPVSYNLRSSHRMLFELR